MIVPGDQADWGSCVEEKIREAMERGEFDDLPGKGRPLDLTPNPFAGDQELAFKVLKDAGCAPEWIELDKAIRGRMERARSTLARQWDRCSAQLRELEARSHGLAGTERPVSSERERERVRKAWKAAVVAFEQEVQASNREIADLNLKVPSPRFQRPRVDARAEIAQLTGAVEWPI
jgi:DnaJ family protein C protein 28